MMNVMRHVVLCLAVCATSGAGRAALADADLAGQIQVQVAGLRNDKGALRCSLYRSADGYPTNPGTALLRTRAAISGGAASCRFDGVPIGAYAVAFFHDENDNGKLDLNLFGIPKEGTGASNDARGHMGPPKWQDARFEFKGGVEALRLSVHY